MSASTTTPAPAAAPQQAKAKKREKKVQPAGPVERLKVVVRRLPPNLPEEVFWQSALPWVTDETVSWKAFHAGKTRKRINKENVSARAYIAFKTEEHVAAFSREYDGHLFQDKTGNTTMAVVEFAPYQKIPPEKKKADPRMNTIEADEDFISFTNAISADPGKLTDADTLEAYLAQSTLVTAPKTTPLLEALMAEKAAQRDKDAILRNHAHYRDLPASATASAKMTGRPTPADSPVKSKKEKEKRKDHIKKDASIGPTTEKKPKKGPSKGASQPTAASNGSATVKPPTAAITTSSSAAKPTPTIAGSKSARKAHMNGQPAEASLAAGSVPNLSTSATQSAPPAPASSTPSGGDPPQIATASSRRGRPVLGLASRQFEAALSGAGVRAKARLAQDVAVTAVAEPPTPHDTGSASAPLAARGGEDDPSAQAVSRGGASGRGRGRSRGRSRGGLSGPST